MKTKTYTFTTEEIMVLRDATIEYHQLVKGLKPNSPIAIRGQKLASALKDQFKDDARIM